MGIALEHENYATGVSMRKVSTQVGSTGNNGRTEGLPEVQESVLEHAAPEANQKPRLAGRLAGQTVGENDSVVKSVICTENGQGRAVFDRKNLEAFLESYSDDCIPIYEGARMAGIIPLRLAREVLEKPSEDTSPKSLLVYQIHQNQLCPSV